jgi:hypothetical protein
VEWICTDTAQWIKTQFGYAEADRILAEVNTIGISLKSPPKVFGAS